MFTAITAFFQGKKIIMMAILAIAIGGYIAALNIQLSYAKSKLNKEKAYNIQLESENADLVRKNDDWRISLDQVTELTASCNASISDLEKKVAENKIKAAEAIKKAEAISALRQNQINQASARPGNPGGGCALSIQHAKSDLGIKK
jgi:hypothetical protein